MSDAAASRGSESTAASRGSESTAASRGSESTAASRGSESTVASRGSESTVSSAARRLELTANLADVRARIAAACAAAMRDPAEVVLIAVTKTFPAADVAILAELGVRDVGENRDQEAAAKVADVAALLVPFGAGDGALAPRWHFVGGLQTNKCASVASYASLVHSVDRDRVVQALGAAGAARAQPVRCLVQVDLDDVARPGRAGARPDDVPALAAAISAHEGLELSGVMAVAPLAANADRVFDRLAQVAAHVVQRYPDARIISAGMSGDLESAVAKGATHLRVGSALLGFRRHPVG